LVLEYCEVCKLINSKNYLFTYFSLKFKGGNLEKKIKSQSSLLLKDEKTIKKWLKKVEKWSFELISGIDYLHDNYIIHQNIAPKLVVCLIM